MAEARWIAAREELPPEMDDKRWIPSGDRSRPDMDRDRIWMDDRIWIDDRRWMTGDGSRETDDNQSPFLYEDIEVMRSYTLLEITYCDFKLRSYTATQVCRHTMYRRHSSTEYDTDNYSEHYSAIPNYAATCPSSNAEYDPESDPESHSNNADTAHHEALRD